MGLRVEGNQKLTHGCRERLRGNEEEKPNQPNAKPNSPSEPVGPKVQPDDIQLKKALELLRDKAVPAQRGA